MDAKQFDELVARLAEGPSRREALKGLVGGTLAAIGVSGVAEGKGKGKGKQRKGKGKDRGKNVRAQDEDQDDVEDENNRRRRRRRRRRRNRCKKIGKSCSKNKKCCSKFCNSVTGTCAEKPVS